MKILSRSPHDSSFSFSRRFNWRKKLDEEEDNDGEVILKSIHREDDHLESAMAIVPRHKKKSAVSKLRSAFTSLGSPHSGTSTKVVGTLFGYRRGHVHFAFQADPRSAPEFLIELEAPTSVLVREMASGLVRIALECDRNVLKAKKKSSPKLLEEPVWKAYCNGRKCGFGVRRDLGLEDSWVLRTLEPVTMGAGVLPGVDPENCDGTTDPGELMYMRARFERVVGSRDSEAFYMMNPEGSGGPELSVYLLRV